MSSDYSGSASSDLSEETPPLRRKSTSTLSVGDKSAGDKSLNLSSRSRGAMTPEEKKKQKDVISDKYFKLMEKYGPKRKFLQEKDQTLNGEEGPPPDPVGFVIKFRLSHAYKALEKQEIEASTPDIKPVRKRKRTKFLLPDERRSEVDTLIGGSMMGVPSSGTGTGTGTGASTARTQATRKVQIRIRTGSEKENAGTGGGGKGGVWQALTKQKASASVQLKEKQQREERQQDQKGGKGKKEQFNQGQSGKGQSNQKQSNQTKQSNQKQSNPKQSNQKQSNQKQLPNKAKLDNKRPQSAVGRSKNLTEAEKQEERQRAIERSLKQLRMDTRQQKDRRTKELWDSHFKGVGGMGLPGSIGAPTDYSYRMFSDTCFSGSITMDAVTMTYSRPSSPSKSFIDGGSRPSSSGLRRGTSQSPKPRTSTPANGRAASPVRPHTARVRTPAANVRPQGERRRVQSAGPPGGKTPNDSGVKGKGGKSLTAILRVDGGRGAGGKEGAGKEGENKVLAPRKISKYLYHMCNCHQVARKDTLSKLYKKKTNVAGVIDLFGCPDSRDPRARVLACPFCNIVPKRRINAWLDNIEDE